MKKPLLWSLVFWLVAAVSAVAAGSEEETTGAVAMSSGQYREAPMLAELVAAG